MSFLHSIEVLSQVCLRTKATGAVALQKAQYIGISLLAKSCCFSESEAMSESSPHGETPESHAVLMWAIAVILMAVGGTLALYGVWIAIIPGLILLLLASFSMAVAWAKSRRGRIALCFFLVLAGLALSWSMVLAACSNFHI